MSNIENKIADVEKRADAITRHIGMRLRAARNQAGMSQEKAADVLGLTFQQVQKYESGANRVSPAYLVLLAEHLGKPLSWFFDGVPTSDFREVETPDRCAQMLTLPYGPEVLEAYTKLTNQQRECVWRVARELAVI